MSVLPNRILVTGVSGQVGKAFLDLLGKRVIPADRSVLDLSRPELIGSVLNELRPDAIIHPAAYTQVDLAESQQELATLVNHDAVSELARWCAKKDAPFISYSTDYVFDGQGTTAWKESDTPNPQSIYGRTKWEGEKAIQSMGGHYLIFRTSWVYDETGKNFLNTMLRLGAEREELKVVSDQIGAPTYATDLAEWSLMALEKALSLPKFPSGIYHLCSSGEASWHSFAEEIFSRAKEAGIALQAKRVLPILSQEYPTPAKRPLNSRLSLEKVKRELGIHTSDWRQGLKRCLARKWR